MHTKKTKYIKTGDTFIWLCADAPVKDSETILEERLVLFSEDGYDLIRISDNENIGTSIWLKDGDTQENYTEKEHVEDDNSVL